MAVVERLVARIPPSAVRFVGRHQFRWPILRRLVNKTAAPLRSGQRTIAHGVGAGLQFNAGGGNPGYVLGTTEPDLQQRLSELLRPGAVFYDVGANVGFFSAIAARLVGREGRLVAIEPSPPTAERLRRNMELNGFDHVTVVEAAASARPGRAAFSVQPLHRSAGSRLSAISRPPHASETTVETVTIDQLIDDGMPPPDVIKLDIEGAEVDALAGMVTTLRRARPTVLCETHGTADKVIALLEAAGYEISFAEGEDASDWNRHVIATPDARPGRPGSLDPQPTASS
jgi:FkbM family methyltransferase